MRWKLKNHLAVGTQQQAAKRTASNKVGRPETVLHTGPPQNYCEEVPSHVPKEAFFHPYLKTMKPSLSLTLTGLAKPWLILSGVTWNFTPRDSDPSYSWSQDPLTEATRRS